MQETPLGYPYLEYTDQPDLARGTKGLADAAELLTGQDRARIDNLTTQTGGDPSTSLIDPTVGSLPSSPVDGQIVYILASANVRWMVQYVEATDLWIFLGGHPLLITVDGLCTRTNVGDNGYAAPDTGAAGPNWTPLLDGSYRYRLSARIDAAADGQEAAVGLKIGSGSVDDDAAIVNFNARFETVTGPHRSTGQITTADNFVTRYRNNGTAHPAQFSHRSLEVQPLTLAPAA